MNQVTNTLTAATSFDLTNFPAWVKDRLKQSFTEPSPIQSEVWPVLSTGRDVVAVSKTGSGKTLAYLLPSASQEGPHGPPTTLVLVPTRELALQIATEAGKFLPANRFITFFGGASKTTQLMAYSRNRPSVIIATPGRLVNTSNFSLTI